MGLFQFYYWWPLVLFSCCHWELHHISSPKKYKIPLWLLLLLLILLLLLFLLLFLLLLPFSSSSSSSFPSSSSSVLAYQCQIVIFTFNPNFTNSIISRSRIKWVINNMSNNIKYCSIFMFVTFMSTIWNHIILFYHSSFPWPSSNFLQNTYVYLLYTCQFFSPVHSLLLLCTMCMRS
jgi:hypothetical protein